MAGTVTPETPPTVSAGTQSVGGLTCCEDCTTCLCPDGFRWPSSYVSVTLAGFTGFYAVFNGTWTPVARIATSSYQLISRSGGADLTISITCGILPNRLNFGLFYGIGPAGGPYTESWQTDGFFTMGGGDSCNPLFTTRTVTENAIHFTFPTTYVTTSETYTITVFH